MAKKISATTALIAALALCGCSRLNNEDTRPTREARQAFTIDLPADCTMTGGQRRLDFATLQVSCGRVAEIGIYAGNAPNIDQNDEGFALRSDIPGRSTIVVAKDPAETVRGYLWETRYRWPARLHVWIEKGQENDALARRVAASVRPIDPNPGPVH